MDKFQYELNREVRILVDDLLLLKETDFPEFVFVKDELKRDLGQEFYDKYIKEHLEI
jgi:hypothetical protein